VVVVLGAGGGELRHGRRWDPALTAEVSNLVTAITAGGDIPELVARLQTARAAKTEAETRRATLNEYEIDAATYQAEVKKLQDRRPRFGRRCWPAVSRRPSLSSRAGRTMMVLSRGPNRGPPCQTVGPVGPA
jgi:hypothetical protein